MKNVRVKGRITYGWKGAPGVAFTTTAECADGKRRVCQVWTHSPERVTLRVDGAVVYLVGDDAKRYCEERSAEYNRVSATFRR